MLSCMRWQWALLILLFSSPAFSIIHGHLAGPKDLVARSTVFLYETKQRDSDCTAVLIAPHTVLTAAHCLATTSVSAEEHQIGFGLNSSHPDELRRVVKITIAPLWKGVDRSTNYDWHDLALLEFEGKAPAGYKPAEILSPEVTPTKVLVAGYGDSLEVPINYTLDPNPTLHFTELRVKKLDFSSTEILLDESHGSGPCLGDSGGPAYAVQNGKLFLAGITSRPWPYGDNENCDVSVIYTRASVFRGWIKIHS